MKKRNLLLIVCIMLAAILTLVSCGNKGDKNDPPPHEHTFNTSTYVSDATNHWYGASCEHSELKLNVAAHADVNKDGVCDTCEYVTCTHTFNEEEWTSDETNHWHAATCGCEVTKDVAEHADKNKDGVCDVCEYVTCTHTTSDEWSADENGHWHEYTCGCELTPAVSAHVDNNKNGVCDVCEYVTCEHEPEDDWSYDMYNHWHASYCDCEIVLDEAAHADGDGDGACDVCGFICEHPASEEWSYDADNHWHDAICDHEVDPYDVEAHFDNNRDGACDVCKHEDPSHTHTWELAYNKYQHYYVSTCEHVIVKDFDNHADEDEDDCCDTCGAYMASLEDIIYDATSKDAANKVSGGVIYDSAPETLVFTYGNGSLTCSTAFMSGALTISKDGTINDGEVLTLESLAGTWTGEEIVSAAVPGNSILYTFVINSDGTGTVSYTMGGNTATYKVTDVTINGNFVSIATDNYTNSSVYTNYTYYSDYIYYTLYGGEYYLSSYEKDGVPTLFKVYIWDDGTVEPDPYASDLAELDGAYIGIMYNYINAYGVENFIYAIYDYANGGDNVVYNYVETYDADTNTFTFSFYYLEASEWSGTWLQSYDVSVTLEDGAIKSAYINAYEYEEGKFFLDTENDVCIVYPNASTSMSYNYHIEQTIGERSDDENPYSHEELTMDELVLINQATGEQIKNGDTVVILAGKDNALTIVVPDKDVDKLPNIGLAVSYSPYDWALVGATYSGNKYPFVLYTVNKVNTYTITFESSLGILEFTLVVDYTAPTSIKGATVDAEGNKTEASTANVYVGSNITLGAIPNNNTSSSRVTASVTTGDPDAVTLTADGNNWIFNADEAGVYTVTLASAGNPAVTTSIVVTVTDAPAAGALLVGTHHLDMMSGENGIIKFTPDYEGAASGTVRIVFDDGNFFDRVVIDETASYEYVNGEIVLTHLSGDGLDKIGGIKFSDTYEIVLVIWPYGAPVMVNEYTFELGEDVIIPDGTQDAPYTITESTDIDATLGEGEALHYIFMPEANGTVTISFSGSDDANVGYGKLNFMLLDPMFQSSVTVDVNKNEPLYIKIDTWSGEATDYDVSVVFEEAAAEGPTLSALAGTWEGTESGSMIYQGKVFNITLNIGADGTGTGTHSSSDIGDFNILSVAIDGANVTITTDAKSSKKVLYFTYEDGNLTMISGNMGMMFGNSMSLTQTSSAGGDEGGDEVGGIDHLVGTWEGTESGSMIYAGQTFDIIFNIGADGTGTGTHGENSIGNFNILSVEVDGDTVIITTDAKSTNKALTFTYSNGTLTLASGMGMMFGNSVELTITSSAGGDEGDDDALTLESLAGTWEGTEISGIVGEVSYTITINADGTGNGVYNDGFDRSFNFTVTIDGNTVSIATNTQGNKTLVFTYENGNLTIAQAFMFGPLTLTKGGSSEGGDALNVESLAGTWSGEEFSSVMPGSSISYTFVINADGTGSGSYDMGWGATNFNVTEITVDDNTVTMATTGNGNQTLVFTYDNGTLTCSQAFMFGTLTLSQSGSSEGGDEGGDDEAETPTLDNLAGSWIGSEPSPYGPMWDATYEMIFNANGTGNGSYTTGVGPSAYTTIFDITAIVIDGNQVTVTTETVGDYAGSVMYIVFTYENGVLTSTRGLMDGTLTMEKGEPAAEIVGGDSYDNATVLDLANGSYITTIAAGEKVYFSFEDDGASENGYAITFTVTSGYCTLYTVTYNMMGETATPSPESFCNITVDMFSWKGVVAIENNDEVDSFYEIEVVCVAI